MDHNDDLEEDGEVEEWLGDVETVVGQTAKESLSELDSLAWKRILAAVLLPISIAVIFLHHRCQMSAVLSSNESVCAS